MNLNLNNAEVRAKMFDRIFNEMLRIFDRAEDTPMLNVSNIDDYLANWLKDAIIDRKIFS